MPGPVRPAAPAAPAAPEAPVALPAVEPGQGKGPGRGSAARPSTAASPATARCVQVVRRTPRAAPRSRAGERRARGRPSRGPWPDSGTTTCGWPPPASSRARPNVASQYALLCTVTELTRPVTTVSGSVPEPSTAGPVHPPGTWSSPRPGGSTTARYRGHNDSQTGTVRPGSQTGSVTARSETSTATGVARPCVTTSPVRTDVHDRSVTVAPRTVSGLTGPARRIGASCCSLPAASNVHRRPAPLGSLRAHWCVPRYPSSRTAAGSAGFASEVNPTASPSHGVTRAPWSPRPARGLTRSTGRGRRSGCPARSRWRAGPGSAGSSRSPAAGRRSSAATHPSGRWSRRPAWASWS